jgi:hypothetical protein
MRRQTVGSKWLKHLALSEVEILRRFLPETRLLSRFSLQALLRKYSIIYLKPVIGSEGHGIIRVVRESNGYLIKHSDEEFNLVLDENQLIPVLKRLTHGRKYIIQQGIDLMTIEGRPLDFRILLLRPENQWLLMGIMGKWGPKDQIVTNRRRGGEAITLDEALQRGFGLESEKIDRIRSNLAKIGFIAAKVLQRKFNVREAGIDVAIDSNLKIWILEVNTTPLFNLFKYDPDQTLFNKIYSYVKQIRNIEI